MSLFGRKQAGRANFVCHEVSQPKENRPSSLCLCLERLFLRGLDHDEAEERADERSAREQQEHGDPDGPFARGKEIMQRVTLENTCQSIHLS